jgi:cytochrome b6-f complex iron-sulfur subunit
MRGTTRRQFLYTIGGIWALLCALPVLGILFQFITPPADSSAKRERLLVGSTADVEPGGTKVVRFNKEPVILVHMPSGQFRAFSARCTHLGCVVQFQNSAEPHFECNCHGSQFDIYGKNTIGPASRPLPPFRVNVEGTSVYLTKV